MKANVTNRDTKKECFWVSRDKNNKERIFRIYEDYNGKYGADKCAGMNINSRDGV